MAKDPSKARKFFSLFGATQYPRTEVRERWSELQKRASKLPKTNDSIKTIDNPLEQAKGIIFKDIKDDKARQKSIDEGTALLNSVELAIKNYTEALAQKQKDEGGPEDPVDDPPVLKKLSGKERAAAKKAAEYATQQVDILDGAFKQAQQAGELDKRHLSGDAMQFHPNQLQLRISAIYEMISEQPVTPERAEAIRQETDTVSKLVTVAVVYNKQGLHIADQGLAKIREIEESGEYQTLAKALQTDMGATSLAQEIEKLRVLCRSPRKFTEAIEKQQAALEKLFAEVKKDPNAYAGKYAKSDDQKELEKQTSDAAPGKIKEFDEAVEKNLAAYCTAMEVARKGNTIVSEIKKIHQKLEKDPTASAATEAKAFNERLTKETATLKADWKKKVEEYNKLETELKSKVDTLGKDMRDYPNLELEWIQIDNLQTAFTAGGVMVEATQRSQGDDLQAKMALGKKLEEKLAALEKDKPTLEKFAGDLRRVKLALKDNAAAGEKSPLAKFYPDDRKKLAEDCDKLEKALPTKSPAEAQKDLGKLLAVLGDGTDGSYKGGTVKQANEAYAKKKEFDGRAKVFSKIMNEKSFKRVGTPGRVAKTPQAYALDEYQALSDKRPLPPIAELQTAIETVEKMFAKITDNKDFLKTMGDGQKGREENDRWKDDTEKEVPALDAQVQSEMKSLNLRFADVKAEVKTSNGDENLLKSAEKSYDDVKKRVGKFAGEAKKAIAAAHKKRSMVGDSDEEKKKIADGLKAELEKMKDDYIKDVQKVARKVEALSANPRGEKGERKRMLVPLRNKLRHEVKATRTQLTEFAGQVEDFAKAVEATDPERAAKLRKFIPRVEKYRDKVCQLPHDFDKAIKLLIDDNTPDAQVRAAREKALKLIGAGKRRLMKHPLTLKFAKSPFPTIRTSGKRLNAALRRLEFTVLTSVGP